MTKLDDLTKEVVKEMNASREETKEDLNRWSLDGDILAENVSIVLSNDMAFGLSCVMNPEIITGIKLLMYLAYRVGVKKGRGDMLEELVGGVKE